MVNFRVKTGYSDLSATKWEKGCNYLREKNGESKRYGRRKLRDKIRRGESKTNGGNKLISR